MSSGPCDFSAPNLAALWTVAVPTDLTASSLPNHGNLSNSRERYGSSSNNIHGAAGHQVYRRGSLLQSMCKRVNSCVKAIYIGPVYTAFTSTVYTKGIFPLFELEENLLSFYQVTNEKEPLAPCIRLLVICNFELQLRRKKKNPQQNTTTTLLLLMLFQWLRNFNPEK